MGAAVKGACERAANGIFSSRFCGFIRSCPCGFGHQRQVDRHAGHIGTHLGGVGELQAEEAADARLSLVATKVPAYRSLSSAVASTSRPTCQRQLVLSIRGTGVIRTSAPSSCRTPRSSRTASRKGV